MRLYSIVMVQFPKYCTSSLGGSKIIETVKIHDAVVPLHVRYPMNTRPRIVQIHNSAFISAHAAR